MQNGPELRNHKVEGHKETEGELEKSRNKKRKQTLSEFLKMTVKLIFLLDETEAKLVTYFNIKIQLKKQPTYIPYTVHPRIDF